MITLASIVFPFSSTAYPDMQESTGSVPFGVSSASE